MHYGKIFEVLYNFVKCTAKVENYVTKIPVHFWHYENFWRSCRQSKNIPELCVNNVENIPEYTGISKNSGIFSTFSTYVESFSTFGFGFDGKSTSKVGIIFKKNLTKSTVRYIFAKVESPKISGKCMASDSSNSQVISTELTLSYSIL